MSLLDQAAKQAEMVPQQANYCGPVPTAPPPGNLKERMMQHEQRIRTLEVQNEQMRQALLLLAEACKLQLGLEIE